MNPIQKWKRTTIANRLLVASTAVMALGTLFLALAAGFQYLSAREQGKTAIAHLQVITQQSKAMQGQLGAMQEQAISLREQTAMLKESLNETRKSTEASVTQAKASSIQANVAQRVVAQNERIVRMGEMQARASVRSAEAAERSSNVTGQVNFAYIVRLVSLGPNQPIVAELNFINKSNVIANFRGGLIKLVLSKRKSEQPSFEDAAVIKGFTVLPQSEVLVTRLSRLLSEQEFNDLVNGGLQAYIFVRIDLEGASSPSESCWVYSTGSNGFLNCDWATVAP